MRPPNPFQAGIPTLRRHALVIGALTTVALLFAPLIPLSIALGIVSELSGEDSADGWFVVMGLLMLVAPFAGCLASRQTIRIALNIRSTLVGATGAVAPTYFSVRRRNAVAAGIAAAVAAGFLLPLPFVLNDVGGSDSPLAIYAIVCATPVGLFVYRRAAATSGVILWLRPFHLMHSRSVDMIVKRACRGSGRCITLQDTVLRRSLMAGVASQWIAAAVAIPLLAYGSYLSGIVAVSVIANFVSADSADFQEYAAWPFAAGAAAWMLGSCVYIATHIRRYGVVTLEGAYREDRLRLLLMRIRRGRIFPGGVHIVRCPDDFWRDGVSTVIRHADVIVIDVTHLTENIEWEIGEALRLVSPQRVVLLYHSDGDHDDIPHHVVARLERQVGTDVQTCQRIVVHDSSSKDRRQLVAERLQRLIQVAISEKLREGRSELDGLDEASSNLDIDGWLRVPVAELHLSCFGYGAWAVALLSLLIGPWNWSVDIPKGFDMSVNQLGAALVWYFAKVSALFCYSAWLIARPLRTRSRAFVRLMITWYGARITFAVAEVFALIFWFHAERSVVAGWLVWILCWLVLCGYFLKSRRVTRTFQGQFVTIERTTTAS